MLSDLSMQDVQQHYLGRQKIHLTIMKAFDERNATIYVPLALGIQT